MRLKIENLSKRTENKWILRDIGFEVSTGRVFGVCGATGSGKTTLMTVIAGLEKMDSGKIALDGRDLSAGSTKDRGIFILSDEKAGNIFSIFTGSSSKRSTGESHLQRFEVAVSNADKILLLDDPFCRMSEQVRKQCFEKLREWVSTEERMVIFASSDFFQIASLADEAAILSGGEFKQTGTAQEIYENPKTVDAAIISGGTNLLLARRLSSTDADRPEFQTIDGNHRIFARAVEKSRLGAINQNLTLSIRPEHVSLSMGASFPEDNLIRGVVTSIKFSGSTSLIRFDADGLALETRVFTIVGLNVGDVCMLGLPPDRILILQT